MTRTRWLALAVFLALIAAFFALGLQRYLTLEALQASREKLIALRDAQPVGFSAAYFFAYVAMATLSLPGAGVMTLAGGAIFGLAWGTVLVSFASSVGALCAMLAARFMFHDAVQARYGDRLKGFNEGFRRDGPMYLAILRMTGAPYFLINLAMGLVPIRAWTFYWVSQLAMLPITIAFIYAGSQLGAFKVSGTLLLALAGLGVLPLLMKKVAESLKVKKVYARFDKPKSFDRNLIVIGGGSAGLVTAYIAAAVKAKVTLIEKHKMGGDCLNTGCVPSKAILRSAKLLDHVRRAREFGLRAAAAEFDFADVMARVHRVIKAIAPHDSAERYAELGVECLTGHAMLVDPWTVEITAADGGKQRLTAESIVIAAGGEPFVPPIPGLAETGYLTSDTVWDLRVQPKRLVVLGGGPIGSELTQAFARLGSQVTQVEMLPRILPREDTEISAMVMERFKAEGIDVRVNTKAKAVQFIDNQKMLIVEKDGKEEALPFDEILVAVGRVARLKGYGLQELGIEHGRTIKVNEYLQTNFPNIYACGDVAGPYQFTHTAAHMAWYCAVNALFGKLLWARGGKFKVDYSVIPWATFTEPEVARVGLNELEAKEKNIPYEVTTYGIDDLDRAIADEEAHGLVKVLTVPGKDKILGVTIAGEHGGDILAEYVLAMRHGIGLNKILGTIHIYPTLAEMNKYVAGNWKKAHKPEGLLKWVEKFHAWSRS